MIKAKYKIIALLAIEDMAYMFYLKRKYRDVSGVINRLDKKITAKINQLCGN